jgi:hypothetical protein
MVLSLTNRYFGRTFLKEHGAKFQGFSTVPDREYFWKRDTSTQKGGEMVGLTDGAIYYKKHEKSKSLFET